MSTGGRFPGAKGNRTRAALPSVGDVHRPLHTAQLFTIEYPQGDRGGNEICVPGDANGAADGPAQVLGRGDYH
jgi:hypothetical protein